jgi:Copper transport outer membrane protein, MctB
VVSFRYLVVTVVSIFLALGLGILAGTTVLNQGLVKNLRENTRAAERRAKGVQHDLQDLEGFATQAVPRLVHGRLAHRDVVIVSDDNTDPTAVSEARDFLQEAKARVVAELHVRSTIAPDNAPGSSLRQILSSSGAPTGGDLTTDAARLLANRLSNGPPLPSEPKTSKPQGGDLLAALLSGGFLDFPHTSPPNPQDVGGAGQTVVVIAGGTSDPAVPFTAFMIPFVEQLVRDGMPVAAGEPLVATNRFVGALRDDPKLPAGQGLVTVDDLSSDTPLGGVALVLGLTELIRFGQGGDYGVKDASSIIPKAS